jgi:hypothetical protein
MTKEKSFTDHPTIRKACFPIAVSKAAYIDTNGKLHMDDDHIQILRTDTNKLISVRKADVKIVSNQDVIGKILEATNDIGLKPLIDESYTYLTNQRMRLGVTFPEVKVDTDDSKGGDLRLHIHNSYDGSEGVRCIGGVFQLICSNGMISGKILGRYYHRHTSGLDVEQLKRYMVKLLEKIPIFERRIKILRDIKLDKLSSICKDIADWNKEADELVQAAIDKGEPTTESNMEDPRTAYGLLCLLTYWITHQVKIANRYEYGKRVAELFNI